MASMNHQIHDPLPVAQARRIIEVTRLAWQLPPRRVARRLQAALTSRPEAAARTVLAYAW